MRRPASTFRPSILTRPGAKSRQPAISSLCALKLSPPRPCARKAGAAAEPGSGSAGGLGATSFQQALGLLHGGGDLRAAALGGLQRPVPLHLRYHLVADHADHAAAFTLDRGFLGAAQVIA